MDNLFELEEVANDLSGLTINVGNENICFEEGSDFIVSIHRNREKSSHCGCGVIVDNYLVTAGHVAVEKGTNTLMHDIYVLFKDEYIDLHDKDIVYDGRGKNDENGIHDDLIIFRFNVRSPFVLYDGGLEIGLRLCTKTFDIISKDKLQSFESECWVKALQSNSFSDQTKIWLNCFVVNNPSSYKEGNSGSPVFRNNNVYGIMLGGDARGNNGRLYTILKASYIKTRLFDQLPERWCSRLNIIRCLNKVRLSFHAK